MKDPVLYIHGKGGSAAESEHYRPLFPDRQVIGLEYQGSTPWEAGPEIRREAELLAKAHGRIILIANSIGAFYAMHAGIDAWVRRAYFISPVVDLEGLIRGSMARAGVTEAELEARGVIPTEFGEPLSWDYLRYVREHPLQWQAPTEILYGGRDGLCGRDTLAAFAQAHGARLTVMEEGEHWFHTPEQMKYLDAWILSTLEPLPVLVGSTRLPDHGR